MSNQTNPAWDYYMTWHSFLYAKALIDKVLTIMDKQEFPSPELYQEAQSLVREAEGYLRETFR